jgi:adenylate kinase family enzyme
LVLGEPASGKSEILKNIGFKLANENKDVYIVELKKHSRDEVKRYFDDMPEIKAEKALFIVDDVHLQLSDCERLVRVFKNKNLKSKLIIGSRPTREIRGEHPKEASVFEYLSTTEIHAEDVTEEMILRFLKRKYDFSDERIKTVEVLSREFENSLEPIKDKIKPIEGEFSEEEVFEEVNKKT